MCGSKNCLGCKLLRIFSFLFKLLCRLPAFENCLRHPRNAFDIYNSFLLLFLRFAPQNRKKNLVARKFSSSTLTDKRLLFACHTHTHPQTHTHQQTVGKLCAARRIRNLTDNAKAKTRDQCKRKALRQTKQRKKGG